MMVSGRQILHEDVGEGLDSSEAVEVGQQQSFPKTEHCRPWP
jgi:hypothetical protein